MGKTGGGHRSHSEEKRTRHAHAYFTEMEWAVIVDAAEREVLRPGAWVARAALSESERATGRRRVGDDSGELRAVQTELLELRRLLGNIAGNLNDVARHANTEHEWAPETTRVLALVRDLAGRTEQDLRTVRGRLR